MASESSVRVDKRSTRITIPTDDVLYALAISVGKLPKNRLALQKIVWFAANLLEREGFDVEGYVPYKAGGYSVEISGSLMAAYDSGWLEDAGEYYSLTPEGKEELKELVEPAVLRVLENPENKKLLEYVLSLPPEVMAGIQYYINPLIAVNSERLDEFTDAFLRFLEKKAKELFIESGD